MITRANFTGPPDNRSAPGRNALPAATADWGSSYKQQSQAVMRGGTSLVPQAESLADLMKPASFAEPLSFGRPGGRITDTAG